MIASRAPDYAGPLVGWRVWRVAREGSVLRLRSAVYDERWEPGREVCARCLAAPSPPHRAPLAACSCGIYAARDAGDAVRYLVGRNDPDVVHRVVGLVALWGVVVEGARGWRAARAYPARIHVPARQTSGAPVPARELAAALADYRVPVDVLPAFEPATLALEISLRLE